MRKALWIVWLAIVWFFSLVFHSVAIAEAGFQGIALLLGVFWLIYLAGLWFEQTHVTDTAWAMLLGYAIACIRLLDLLPNQQQYANRLKHVPKFIVGGTALLFINIHRCIAPVGTKRHYLTQSKKSRFRAG